MYWSARTTALPASSWPLFSGDTLKALRWAVENGILNGNDNGIFDPAGLTTCAEAAQMLENFIER